jgi:hypothetical protein
LPGPGVRLFCGNDVPTYFTDYFNVKGSVLDRYGAFNISVITDLPLFIDPFLLFNSRKAQYRKLHAEMIRYLGFLRDKAAAGPVSPGLMRGWFQFPEVKQTWLGFSAESNRGRGLGGDFAAALHGSLHSVFSDFGREKVTKGSHLEKLCLIKDGVGRDNISDFTTNLIKAFLCNYTQSFAKAHLKRQDRRTVAVPKVRFNYNTETWETDTFELPWANGDYVLLTPREILTRIDTWINKSDLVDQFARLPAAISNLQLREQVNNYFVRVLQKPRDKAPTKKDLQQAAVQTILKYPSLIDAYIRFKEDHGEEAVSVSAERVSESEKLYVEQVRQLQLTLARESAFYRTPANTHREAHQRIEYLKDVIENKGGYRRFYVNGRPLEREEDVHILYRLTWFGTPSDVSSEVNDGRGPADFKISRGSRDKTIVEFKLAKNTQLKRNLERQAEVYKQASSAKHAINVIVYFSAKEHARVMGILAELGLSNDPDVVLIDARSDNKPSGSRA